MKEVATIYDFSRFCRVWRKNKGCCEDCPLGSRKNKTGNMCYNVLIHFPDEANEIILSWLKEHPVQIRQDKLLKILPNAVIDANGVLAARPCKLDKDIECPSGSCDDCRKNYWLEEVTE